MEENILNSSNNPFELKKTISSFNLEEEAKKLNLKITDFSVEKFEKNKESIESLLDRITGGKFSDKSYGNHVVNAFNREKEKSEYLGKSKEEREKFILKEQLNLGTLFMSFGHSEWTEKDTNLVVFFSNKNPYFKKVLEINFAELLDIDIESTPLEEMTEEKLFPLAKNERMVLSNKIERDLKEKGAVDFYGEFHGYPMAERIKSSQIESTFIYCLMKKIPIIDNHSNGAFIIDFGYMQEIIEKKTGVKFSWGLIADTIVDLVDKKMYEYEPVDPSASK